MARLPRIVLPGIAHHVTQRGNRRERTFFEDGDYALYLDLLADASRSAGGVRGLSRSSPVWTR
jgi:putative transposase